MGLAPRLRRLLSPALAVVVAVGAASLGAPGCTLNPYECSLNANCVLSGQQGSCVPALGTRYCAFADTRCPAPRLRWDESADPSLAGSCVAATDMRSSSEEDMASEEQPDLDTTVGPCEQGDPLCERVEVVAPFPLQRDPIPNPAQTDTGLERTPDGDLTIGKAPVGANFMWIANSQDAGSRGTVSKFDTRAIKEVARYLTVTCGSLKTGNTNACDGLNGCCSADDVARYRARAAHQNEPIHQAVNLMFNQPSQTAVDFNGDAFVENVGQSGQSSLTKIANNISSCIDRNRNGRIETSSDTNADGVITIDCNGDNQPDDIASVQGKPCTNNLRQEYYGLDDECVLWTTNVDDRQQGVRAMALASGGSGTGGADAWVIGQVGGHYFRIDGASGLTRDGGSMLRSCNADNAVVDAQGIVWVTPQFNGSLCYFDSRTPTASGEVRAPNWGAVSASSVTLDRDQNVWMASWGQSDAARYTPVRDKGNAALGNGRWIKISRAGANGGAQSSARGIAADSRSMSNYFVWLAEQQGFVIRIPASSIEKLAPGMGDAVVDGSAFPVFRAAGFPTGVVIDADQNVWSIGQSQITLTRAKVDANGMVTAPVINGQPMGNNLCPAADVCSLKGSAFTDTDSDAAGFTLRNFGRGRGTYTWLLTGCKDGNGLPIATSWHRVNWTGKLPPGASLTARARSGPTAEPDNSWGSKTIGAQASPLDLRTLLSPNDNADMYLQIEFLFSPNLAGESPTLHSFSVDFRCP